MIENILGMLIVLVVFLIMLVICISFASDDIVKIIRAIRRRM